MNRRFSFDIFGRPFTQSTLSIVYRRHKEYVVPVLILLVSFLLFFAIIIPQIKQLLFLQTEEKKTSERITALKNNINFLSTLDDADLDEKLQTVSSALPVDKDFTGILYALSEAGAASGVVVGDFSFQVGELATESQITTQPAIEIILTINGGMNAVPRFLHELAKTLPLSQATSVRVNNTSSVITIAFYYRPLTPMVFKEDTLLLPLPQKDAVLIEQLTFLKQ